MKLTIAFIFALSTFSFNAQNNSRQTPKEGNQLASKKAAFSYEKRINGTTVQFYTQEQFDKLEQRRKDYYLSHKDQYRIITPKKSETKK